MKISSLVKLSAAILLLSFSSLSLANPICPVDNDHDGNGWGWDQSLNGGLGGGCEVVPSTYGYVRLEGSNVSEAIVSNITGRVFLGTSAVHQSSTCVAKMASFPYTTRENATVQGTVTNGACSVAVPFDVLDTFDSEQIVINIQNQDGTEWHFKLIVQR